MNSRTKRTRAAVTTVIVVIAFLSGCGARNGATADPFTPLNREVDERVADGDRAERMRAAVEKMEAAVGDLLELSTAQAEALAVLVRDYDTPREEFDRLFADYLERRRPILQRMLAAHVELKEEATPEEWSRLAKKAHAVVDVVAWQSLHASGSN